MNLKVILSLAVCVTIIFCSNVFAEIIYFKDGRVVVESVVEKDDNFTITTRSGAPQRYHSSQIHRIEDDVVFENRVINITQYKNIPLEKIRLIFQYLEATHISETMASNVDRIIDEAPPENQDILRMLFNTDEIIERLVPVYSKHFTADELTQMVSFYENPVGQKVIDVTPEIMKETMAVSMEYVQQKLTP